MAIIFTVMNLASIIADFGFGAAVIQKQDISQRQLSSLFFVNILIGVILFGLIYYSSPLIAIFFGKSELIELLSLFPTSTWVSVLARLLEFDWTTIIRAALTLTVPPKVPVT